MFYDTGCYGRVPLGELPEQVQRKLASLPGEWLEFDAPTGTIVVRHIQPTAGPCLPTIAGELVRMLSEVPADAQARIPGGELFVHTEVGAQLVRLKVEAGGALKIEWAHPDYARARKQLHAAGSKRLEIVEPRVQRLNGKVTFTTRDVARAAGELETLADTYEGLYPEGDLIVTAARRDNGGEVAVEVRELNLDAQLLVETLGRVAAPGTLVGEITVGSFAAVVPEQQLRFVFTDGKTWIQRPTLWPEQRAAAAGAA